MPATIPLDPRYKPGISGALVAEKERQRERERERGREGEGGRRKRRINIAENVINRASGGTIIAMRNAAGSLAAAGFHRSTIRVYL